MAANPLLVGGALLAGGAALWALYKAWQAKQQSAAQQVCAGACGSDATCLAACGLASDAVNAIIDGIEALNPVTNSSTAWFGQTEGDSSGNDKLNGPIKVASSSGIGCDDPSCAVTGAALLYENGCMPFFDAPGWAACAPGTVDMYSSAVAARAGGDGDTYQEGATEAALVTNLENTNPLPDGYTAQNHVAVTPINKNNFMTGMPGDPTTKGPFGAAGSGYEMYVAETGDGNTAYQQSPQEHHTLVQTAAETAIGPWTWLARGTRVTCQAGQVPKTVVLGINGEPNTDPIGTETCITPVGANLCVNGAPPPGFTWSGQGWVRAAAGETINPGPCAPATVGVGGGIYEAGGSGGGSAGQQQQQTGASSASSGGASSASSGASSRSTSIAAGTTIPLNNNIIASTGAAKVQLSLSAVALGVA